jgi:hypothetical protein
MEHYAFEARIPFDHVKHIITGIKDGTFLTNKGQSLMCIASAAGELGAFINTFENPDVVPIGAPGLTQLSADEVLKEVEDFIDEYNTETSQVSPYLLAVLFKALEIALQYLNK